jgi:hypothetical protein
LQRIAHTIGERLWLICIMLLLAALDAAPELAQLWAAGVAVVCVLKVLALAGERPIDH